MRRRRLPVYKAIDDLEISVNNKGAQEILKGPAVFCGCVLNFSLVQNDANQCGNGWITVAVVRYPGNTVKGVGALEGFNSRDVIAYRTYHIGEVFNRDIGVSYFSCNYAFTLRTRNHRKINEQESVCIWVKGAGRCDKVKFSGDVTLL